MRSFSTRSVAVAAAATLVVAACAQTGTSSTSSAPIITTEGSTVGSSSSTPNPVVTTSTPSGTTTTVPAGETILRVHTIATGFVSPVLLVADPSGGEDLVVEQQGTIVGIGSRIAVLDIRDDVVFGGERGLLGLAFHPDFDQNGMAYVNYTGSSGDTVIEQFEVDSSGMFDLESRIEILRVNQPETNHNGGMLAFGPDGYLWIGMGDGGGSDDRFGNGQRADTLLGSMLRIGVGVPGVDRYGIPPDNPYADGEEGAPEVWATGLRNPWRFSFDGADLWVADVGQRSVEEVNRVDARAGALNYGWPVLEGSECFATSPCDGSPFVIPVAEYGHGDGCSITGGYVYRGTALPELAGSFFFSDYCSGFVRSVDVDGEVVDWTPMVGSIPSVTGFGVGGDGELYVVTQTGDVYRLERSG